jgi:hypothetical protein
MFPAIGNANTSKHAGLNITEQGQRRDTSNYRLGYACESQKGISWQYRDNSGTH